MKKNRKNPSLSTAHPPTLSSIGLAVLATLMAGNAQAIPPAPPAQAETSIAISPSTVPPVAYSTSGYQTVKSVQGKTDETTATTHNTTVNVGNTNGTQTGTGNTVTQNTVGANATANTLANTIALSLTAGNTGHTAPEGAASLGLQTNDGVVSSTAIQNGVFLGLTDFASGAAVNSANTISASTTLNSGSSRIAGAVPVDYASTAPGSITFSTTPAATTISADARGSVVVTSAQLGTGGASSATASQDQINLSLTSAGSNVVTAAPVLNNNTISSTLQGNTATNTANIQAGGAPTFSGSAVVANLQGNQSATPVTHTATNSGNQVLATIGSSSTSAGAVNTLQGALSVQGNAISSAATGNQSLGTNGVAGNSILLGDGESVTGSGGTTQNSIAYGSGTSTTVTADLAIYNGQSNSGVSLSSSTSNGSTGATVQSVNGGSVTISGNSITASGTGNAASSAIASGNNAASLSATAALGNQQGNFAGGVSASVSNSNAVASSGAGGVSGAAADGTNNASSLTVSSNRTSATAYGNTISQSLALAANALPLSSANALLTGGRWQDGNVSAAGAATISNLQSNFNSQISASNSGSKVGLEADSQGVSGNTIQGSTFTVNGNTQEAVGVSNSAGNALSLTGTSVGSGAGVANVQIVGSGAPVAASLTDSSAGLVADTNVTGSTLAFTNNLQRAVAYGNTGNNTLSVSANSATVPTGTVAASNVGIVNGGQDANSTVTAAYGVMSNQAMGVNVSAFTQQNSLGVLVDGNATGGSVNNQGNALVAAAYGNDGANGLTLGLGTGVGSTTTPVTGAAVGNVTNVQSVTQSTAGPAVITATVSTAAGKPAIGTSITNGLTSSSVSTSNDQIQALAYGNRATGNTLTVNGNTLATSTAIPGAGSGAAAPNDGYITNAAFSVQNAQNSTLGSVTASLRDSAGASPTTSAGMLTQVGGNVLGSSLTSAGNSASASGTSNSAVNGLTLTGNSISTSSAMQNMQNTSASVNALIGLAGTPAVLPSPAVSFDYQVHGSSLRGTFDHDTDVWSLAPGSQLSTTVTNEAQAAYLAANGWSRTSPGSLQLTRDADPTMSSSFYNAYTSSVGKKGSATIPASGGSPAVPNQGGVTVAVAGAVTNSQLSVNGNTASGAATGNSATNTVAVTGNTIAAGSGQTVASAAVQGTSVAAQADNALANSQQVTGPSTLSSNVFGTFAIDTVPAAVITGSTLSVSGNSQSGSAVANTAANSLSVGASGLTSTSALASMQSSAASVSASSNLNLYAPGSITNSSVDISSNKNTSLGVINDVSNTLAINAANLSHTGTAGNATLQVGGSFNATGDNVLINVQQASTSVSSAATTSLYNKDVMSLAGAGLSTSTTTVTGNTTTAEASANRANNSLALNGTASEGANAGLLNSQTSSAGVTSNATTSATFQLANTAQLTALNSSITFDSNSTTALARGNAATNVLNVAASGYAAPVAGAGSTSAGVAQATAAMQNSQSNSGNVASNATGTYQVALNGLTAGGSVTNDTVAITGNTTAAQAYGNTATNTVTVAAAATGRPTAAIGNYQTNSGTIVATATGVNYGVGIAGAAASGSSLRASGNQITATAVGNSAVSSIAAAAR